MGGSERDSAKIASDTNTVVTHVSLDMSLLTYHPRNGPAEPC